MGYDTYGLVVFLGNASHDYLFVSSLHPDVWLDGWMGKLLSWWVLFVAPALKGWSLLL
jgi:hypothetical protein